MTPAFSRTALVLGEHSLEILNKSHVIIFGLGGVGGYVAEALIRAGVGELSIVDNDVVSESNLNRQIIALHSTIGKNKTDAIEKRAKDINPEIIIHKYNCFYSEQTANQFDFSKYNYIIDCIDTITSKILLIEQTKLSKGPEALSTNFITCLGTGNKIDPMAFKISTIEKTSVCPLAKVMRHELKKREIKKVKCVYSTEIPVNSTLPENENGRHSPGSVSFVPSAAGLLIASEVIKNLCGLN